MSAINKFRYYVRAAEGVRAMSRVPLPASWDELIRSQMENRESNFLENARRIVFAKAEHPYHKMFQTAGCNFGDLETLVTRLGLEAALDRLCREGVYLTHDEFKGKTPIIRSGREIRGGPESFANPLVRRSWVSASSGSRSQGTVILTSAAYRLHREAYQRLCSRELELDTRTHIQISPILPSTVGIGACLWNLRHGRAVDGWLAPAGGSLDSMHQRLATCFLVLTARFSGLRVPFPEVLPKNDATPAARRIDRLRRAGVRVSVGTSASLAVRVAAATADHGLDISDTVFTVGGEALTDAKRRVIEAAGARAYSRYVISEVGMIGSACRHMNSGNSVHLFHDAVAVISRRRTAPLTDFEVNSLLFTTLHPAASYFLINVEIEDNGIIEPARCDCVFSAAGFTNQIRDVGSFGKLTGFGMTLAGTDAVRILEETLPARFGGNASDYQLVEIEDGGRTGLVLRVSPRVKLADGAPVKKFFLKEIRKYFGGSLASRLWGDNEAVEVIIAEPLVSGMGKVLPLHLQRNVAGGKSEP